MSTSKRRVAIAVFCEVEAVDERDAAHIATVALRGAIARDGKASDDLHVALLPFRMRRDGKIITRDVAVHDVMDAGMAAGNGYLWTRPTSKAYPEA
jgi:hypothetical protein